LETTSRVLVPRFIKKHLKHKQHNFPVGKISNNTTLTNHSIKMHTNFFLVKSQRVELDFIKLPKLDSLNLGF
jgi:hypothetical protein